MNHASRAAEFLRLMEKRAATMDDPNPSWMAVRTPHSSRRSSPLRADGMAGPIPEPSNRVGHNHCDQDDRYTGSHHPSSSGTVLVGTFANNDGHPADTGMAVTSNP